MSSATPGRLPAEQVRAMFDRIADRYDLMNRVMTLGMDRRWRRAAARVADLRPGERALDCCCGTGDLTRELASRVSPGGAVVGLDFAERMLEKARPKVAGLPVTLVAGDATRLPFADDEFAAATVGFGVRNLDDLDAGLREMVRVVRPGGRVVILEITPTRALGAAAWFERIVPKLGRLLGKDASAYAYLPASARRFPPPVQLAERMRAAGVSEVEWRPFVFGLVALHWGRAT